jgi:eukaryotic translation initiation factor 2C
LHLTVLAIRKKQGLEFKLTAINCIKRHKTRFFPESKADSDRLGNVLPCTVVENSIEQNDFYTVTQAALQGCCVPTHYVSVVDENRLTPEDIQRLVVNSCFSYQRATRSVKVVPAVYYAHQVADRAKLHLRSSEEGPAILHDVGQDLKYTMVSMAVFNDSIADGQ